MDRNDYVWLIVIIILMGVGVWVVTNEDFPIRQGLDLQGGLQVLLEADIPEDQDVTADQMNTVRQIIDRRVNALGVGEPLVQTEGERRVLVELAGINDTDEALSLIQETALLEFVDTGATPIPEGTCVRTSNNNGEPSRCEFQAGDPVTTTVTSFAPTYEVVLTGGELASVQPEYDPASNTSFISFLLTEEGGTLFEEHTRNNQGSFLTIVLDKVVISSPRISAVISREGTITGDFTRDEAQQFATQLRYGSLPVPLRVESTRLVGATLGEISIQASILAGSLGLGIVLLFMLVYYRLPGFLADIALIGYALLNLAVFQLFSVTLTLPAITGFLLSTGMAVDANILVFERMKEELRKGNSLKDAIRLGFDRAWSSIRDSNLATFVICTILLAFGNAFGASSVQGFAITLMIGVAISVFTAVFVTRTLIRIVMGNLADWLKGKKALLGV